MLKKVTIVKAAVAMALLWLNLFLCNSSQAEDQNYAQIGQWQIKYRERDNLNGCDAKVEYLNGTRLQLVLMQSDTGKQWAVFIYNPAWTWIRKKRQYNLYFVADLAKRWPVTFSVTDDNSLAGSVSIDFMNGLADAYTVTVVSENNYVLTNLSMKDSDDAIKAVVNCVRQHPLNSTSPPEAERHPEGPTMSFGTAFFVAPNRLLTNDHVVKGCRSGIQVRYPEQTQYTATISARDETNDLALLNTNMSNLSVVAFRSSPRLGEQVASFGFPYTGLLSSGGNFTLGNVTSLSGMNDDSRFIQISTPVQPGNSGGPLLDMTGNVVGVVEGQLNAIGMMRIAGSAPQNVNFAIQAAIVVNFLSVKGITPTLDSRGGGARQELTPADVADLAKKFTVQVSCEENPAKAARGSLSRDSNFNSR